MNKTDKNVYIVILNYKNLEDTLFCLSSLRMISYKAYHVVVVDNDSQDGSYEYLKEHETDYTVIQSGENRGYAAGNNVGIRYALAQGAAYVCILNNDVEVEPDFLQKLVSYMEKDPQTGMAGPVVYEFTDRNIIQSAGCSITIGLGKTKSPMLGKNRNDLPKEPVTYCDGLSGACLLIRREALEKAGLIPEYYFLFFEELEWCLNVRKQGYTRAVPVPYHKGKDDDLGFFAKEILKEANIDPNTLNVRKQGYKLAVIHDTGVYHKGSATLKKTGTVSKYYLARNQALFVRRNGTTSDLCLYLLTQGLGYLYRRIFSISSHREIRKKEFDAFWEGLTMDKKAQEIMK